MSTSQIILVTGSGSGIGRAIAITAASAGHIVYASMRGIGSRNAERRDEFLEFARYKNVDLRVLELDVLSEVSCRAAIDQILAEQGRIDVVVNNAGMLMAGMAEAFTPEQFLRILDTNAVSWLRVNRAALPAMRRQGRGLLVYVGSTTSRLNEPFIAPYVASKAAGEALAEAMSFEVSQFGVESVTVVPGAFTSGTEHFRDASGPETVAVETQYGELGNILSGLGPRIDAIDQAGGGSGGVIAVGAAVCELLEIPHGRRPSRLVVDFQKKGVERIDETVRELQTAFFEKLGIAHLMSIPEGKL